MEYTDIYNLPCLGEEDYPAVALYMKNLAELIEAQLSAQQTALEFFLDTGSAIWRGPGGDVIQAADRFPVPIVIDELFSVKGIDQTAFASPSLPALRGWYYVSGNVSMTDAVTTVNSKRQLDMWVSTLGFNAPGTVVTAQFSNYIITADRSVGDSLWASGTVFHDGTSAMYVDMTVLQTQATLDGPVTIATFPLPVVNIVYLGDTPDIREVN